MKFLFSIILFCLVSIAKAQSINPGTYYPVPIKPMAFVSELFQLNEDGSFRYLWTDCQGKGLGKGTYTITAEDSLRLTFIDFYKEKFEDKFTVSKSTSDSLLINLSVKNKFENPSVEFVNVSFPGTSIPSKRFESDKVSLRLLKFTAPQVMRIECPGFAAFDINLPVEYSSVSGTATMNSDWLFMGGLVKNYKIISHNNKNITIMINDKRSTTYQKLNKKELIKWNRIMDDHEAENQPW